MARDVRPFVAVIGGFWGLVYNDPAAAARAKQFAREIGAALARAGMGLVVYFSNDESLEPHVVAGYVAALPSGARGGAIRVRFAESQRGQVHFPEQATHPELFDPRVFPGTDWEAPFYRSLVDAEGVDAVLLMAGARSTLIAGQIALARPLPVLAVDHFGGAAAIVWTELATTTPNYPSASTHGVSALIGWLTAQCVARAAERARTARQARWYARHTAGQGASLWGMGAFLALVLVTYFGTAQAPAPGSYVFLTFVGLIAAGATGALVRSLLRGVQRSEPLTSLFLGSVAGFAVGLAYLIPQYVGAPAVLDTAATVVRPTDKIQFISALLAAIPAGVGFDTVFNRMQRQMETQPPGSSGGG